MCYTYFKKLKWGIGAAIYVFLPCADRQVLPVDKIVGACGLLRKVAGQIGWIVSIINKILNGAMLLLWFNIF